MQKDKAVATYINLVFVLLDRDVYIMCSDNILPTDGERGYFTSTFYYSTRTLCQSLLLFYSKYRKYQKHSQTKIIIMRKVI